MKLSVHALVVLPTIKARHDPVLIANTMPEFFPEFIEAFGMGDDFNASDCLAENVHMREAKHTNEHVLRGVLMARSMAAW